MLCKSLGTLRTSPLVYLCHRRFGERCFTFMIINMISIFINRNSHDQALIAAPREQDDASSRRRWVLRGESHRDQEEVGD